MQMVPFLTELDSRAAIKGSRDPLGIQQIWTRLGRHVIGNLTTVSTSVRDFTTLLLGHYFAEQMAAGIGPGTELASFLKWEQLAAYARATVNNDWAFRGTERVRRNLNEGSWVTLSDQIAHQILSNQKIYGLWGLYTMPARASGLVDGDPARLTPPARGLVEKYYLPLLAEGTGRDARQVRDVLRSKSCRIDVKNGHASLIQAVGRVLKPSLLPPERKFYRDHLLYGGPQDSTAGRQRQLAELMRSTLAQEDFAWSPAAVADLAKVARTRGDDWHPLAHRLERIRISETVLAPASSLFQYLLGSDGTAVADVVDRLRDTWGTGLRCVIPSEFCELRAEIGANDAATGERWVAIAEMLAGGDYEEVVDLLIEQNKSVMATRGGAAWIERRDGRLHVRFRDEQGGLPTCEDLASLWRFPYFLDSLRCVAATLEEN
jgi:hypothetical protein